MNSKHYRLDRPRYYAYPESFSLNQFIDSSGGDLSNICSCESLSVTQKK